MFKICQTSIGISLKSIELGDEGRLAFDYSKSLATFLNIAFERRFMFLHGNDFIFYKTKTGKRFQYEVNKLKKFMDQVVEERIAKLRQKRQDMQNESKSTKTSVNEEESLNLYGKKRKQAFLDLLVETYLDQEKEPFTEGKLDLKGIQEEVNTFTFAGFDTTSSTILSTLYLLGKFYLIII